MNNTSRPLKLWERFALGLAFLGGITLSLIPSGLLYIFVAGPWWATGGAVLLGIVGLLPAAQAAFVWVGYLLLYRTGRFYFYGSSTSNGLLKGFSWFAVVITILIGLLVRMTQMYATLGAFIVIITLMLIFFSFAGQVFKYGIYDGLREILKRTFNIWLH